MGYRNFGKLPRLGFLIFFEKIFLVNTIKHNLYGVEISASKKNKNKNMDFFEIFNILGVKIGKNGPRILGVKWKGCNPDQSTNNNKNIRILKNHKMEIFKVPKSIL